MIVELFWSTPPGALIKVIKVLRTHRPSVSLKLAKRIADAGHVVFEAGREDDMALGCAGDLEQLGIRVQMEVKNV